jgi:hypothetical protein
MAVSRSHISTILNKFFNSLDELLVDIASHQHQYRDIQSIIDLRQLLQDQREQVTYEIETLFAWSFIPTDSDSLIPENTNSVNDLHLSTMVTKLREQHILQLRSIEKLFPRAIQATEITHNNNPFDPVKIYGIANAVFNTLDIDSNCKNLCLREFHYVLKGHLASLYNDVIKTLFK